MPGDIMEGGSTTSSDTIERRLAALEAAVAEIQQKLATGPPNPDGLTQIIGSFKDEPAFEQLLAYGRAFRYADRPPEDEGT